MPDGSLFDGHVQGLGFRFRTEKLVGIRGEEAAALLDEHYSGSLTDLMQAGEEELLEIEGIGPAYGEKLAAAGMGILFVSSELEEILGMSDRTIVMHEGHISGELSRDELSEEAVMQLATGGLPSANTV